MAEFKHLIRVANTDLDGKKAIVYALKNVKGVGFSLANAICQVAGIDSLQKAGDLSDEHIKRLDEIIAAPQKFGIPGWLLNRRRDRDTGEDVHLVTNELIFTKGNDVKLLRRIKSYKGMRHSLGLPARGQKTKSNFRPNKGKVAGVKTAGKKKGK